MRVRKNGLTLSVTKDEDYHNPRFDKNLATILCWYDEKKHGALLWNNLHFSFGDCNSYKNEKAFIRSMGKNQIYVSLPIYLYDSLHGAVLSSTSVIAHNGCEKIGIIYTTKAQAEKWFGALNEHTLRQTLEQFEDEIEAYNAYLSDSFYKCTITDEQGKSVYQKGMYNGGMEKRAFNKCIYEDLPKEYKTLFEKSFQNNNDYSM